MTSTQNTVLNSLGCGENFLTELDLSKNSDLQILLCSENQLTGIDLTKNTQLNIFYCSDNQLTSLDITNNTSLVEFNCSNNPLNSLDISNNTSLAMLEIDDIPTLHEVCVWEVPFPPSGNKYLDVYISGCPNLYFTTECTTNGIIENLQNEISVYPNPANDVIIIVSNSPGNYLVEIYSVDGRLLYNYESNGTSEIDVSNFESGIFIITIKSNDVVQKERILKL